MHVGTLVDCTLKIIHIEAENVNVILTYWSEVHCQQTSNHFEILFNTTPFSRLQITQNNFFYIHFRNQ